MTELLALTERLSISRPVFRLQLQPNGRMLDANTSHPVYRYRPEATEDEILFKLIVRRYCETFSLDEGKFRISKEEIARSAMSDIRSSVTKFLEHNLGMRSPKQSKVYRWAYRSLPNNKEFNDVLVILYKYMRTFCNEDMRALTVENKDEHIKNTVAILEAMQEKYDK